MKNRPFEQVREVMLAKNYKFFEQGDYNLNLIAVREDDVFDNKFSDSLHIAYKENGVWKMPSFRFTTLAGTLGFGGEKAPLTAADTGTGVDGVAIILEGQYPQAYKYVSNGWRYPFTEYLDQVKPFDYLRDNDKNGVVSRKTAIRQSGNFKTCFHGMSWLNKDGSYSDSEFVNYVGSPYSQGCIGSPAVVMFGEIMPIVRKAVKTCGLLFTPTILHASDFKS
jgi:hypothetical protein